MWKDFFHINNHKLKFALIVWWISIFALITLISQILAPEKPSINLSLQIALIYASMITLTAIIVSLLSGIYQFSRKRRIFIQGNWNSYFTANGFKTILLNFNRKFLFTEEAKLGNIKNFDVLVNLIPGQFNHLYFHFFADHIPINKEEYRRHSKKLKECDAGFETGFIYKKIKRNKKTSQQHIETEINIFADMLISEKFIPAPK